MRLPHIVLLAAVAVLVFLAWKHRARIVAAVSK